MSIHREDGSSSGASSHAEDIKTIPEPVVLETSIYKRTPGKAFDNDSRESFYKPIDSYEGRHRYDPNFEWEPKEEKRVVRKVWIIRAAPPSNLQSHYG